MEGWEGRIDVPLPLSIPAEFLPLLLDDSSSGCLNSAHLELQDAHVDFIFIVVICGWMDGESGGCK